MSTYKKLFALTTSIVLMIGVSLGQGISGSAHDFSGQTWNSTGEICATCHTPHDADNSISDAPLWNHEVTTATFNPYTSSSLTATVGQPSGVSKLCLSCHDGTVAIDNFGGATNGSEFATGDTLIGTDLRNDHPVSFTYDATLASNDGGLFDPTTKTTSLGGTIDADLLVSNKLECSSCHDVHDAAGNDHILVIANNASNLCLTCHNK